MCGGCAGAGERARACGYEYARVWFFNNHGDRIEESKKEIQIIMHYDFNKYLIKRWRHY